MKNFLDYASKRYYDGNPIISDAEFDRLAERFDYSYVGAPVSDGIPHTYPMYSLKKCYVGEKQIALDGEKVDTPKFDGAAVSLLYVEGKLILALTRGDGKRGLDITDKMRSLVPSTIDYFGMIPEIFQINGEVMARKEIPNSRNYAAGALNLKSLEEFLTRKLTFVAYSCQPYITETYTSDMHILHECGFYDVCSAGGYLAEEFPTDGKVFRLNSNSDFERAGFTSSHPKGAFALKERVSGVNTKLLDVKWQVGRTGVVSPVAILEPVKIGDATVSKATLHNIKYIQELNLELGCTVEIVRSGEIIPRVVRRV